MQDKNNNLYNDDAFLDAAWKKMKIQLDQEMPQQKKKRRVLPFWWRIGAIAAILLIAVSVAFVNYPSSSNTSPTTSTTPIVKEKNSTIAVPSITQPTQIANINEEDNKSTPINIQSKHTNIPSTKHNTQRKGNIAAHKSDIASPTVAPSNSNLAATNQETKLADIATNNNYTIPTEERRFSITNPIATLMADDLTIREKEIDLKPAKKSSKKIIKANSNTRLWIAAVHRSQSLQFLNERHHIEIGRTITRQSAPLEWSAGVAWTTARQELSYESFVIDDSSDLVSSEAQRKPNITLLKSQKIGAWTKLSGNLLPRWSIGGLIKMNYNYSVVNIGLEQENSNALLPTGGFVLDSPVNNPYGTPNESVGSVGNLYNTVQGDNLFAKTRVHAPLQLNPFSVETEMFLAYQLNKAINIQAGVTYDLVPLVNTNNKSIKTSLLQLKLGTSFKF